MRPNTLVAAGLLLAATACPVAAQEPAHIVIGTGLTGFARHNEEVRETTEFLDLEYRGSTDLWRGVKPLGGVGMTTRSVGYARGGVYRDFTLNPRWILTPHFSVGAAARHEGTDLGNTIEFLSGLDLFYRLRNGWRVGATLSHISNGGLADNNPGLENLGILLALPLN